MCLGCENEGGFEDVLNVESCGCHKILGRFL